MAQNNLPPELRRILQQVRAGIQEHGWFALEVEGGPQEPAWSYSIGFNQTFQQPEILVFGLGAKTRYALLARAAERMRTGQSFRGGQEHTDILVGHPCMFRAIPERLYDKYVPVALFYYGGYTFPALQCIWPDRQGRYPWDPGFDTSLLPYQPLLYLAEGETRE